MLKLVVSQIGNESVLQAILQNFVEDSVNEEVTNASYDEIKKYGPVRNEHETAARQPRQLVYMNG